MPVSKKRKVKTNQRRFRTKKHIPDIITMHYNKIHAHYEEKDDTFRVYINLLCNDTHIIMSGIVDPDKSYHEGIKIHNPKPKKGMTAQTVYMTKKDCPHFFATIKAFTDTIGDLLDEGVEESLPSLDIHNDGEYFSEDDIPKHRALTYKGERYV